MDYLADIDSRRPATYTGQEGIDRLRSEGKRIGVVAGDERASTALDLAAVTDRIDVVVTGWNAQRRLVHALEELGVEPDRAIVMGVDTQDIEAARAAEVELAVGVARGDATPERLRRAGVVAVVADPQELLGHTAG